MTVHEAGPAGRLDRVVGARWLRLAVGVMVVAATAWLSYQFWRLLVRPGPDGAVDLLKRHIEVAGWFAGIPVYRRIPTAIYPPHAYLLLGSIIGWIDFGAARLAWAVVSGLSLVVVGLAGARLTSARAPWDRAFTCLLPAAMYASGAGVGNGQLALPLLACVLGCIINLEAGRRDWARDLLLAAGLILAFIDPFLTAPFLCLLVGKERLRPALLALAACLALTWLASSFQPGRAIGLLGAWLDLAGRDHALGFAAGRPEVLAMAATAALLAGGLFCHLHRRSDPLLLAGILAVVALSSSVHPWYDEALILVPMLALLRLCPDLPRKALLFRACRAAFWMTWVLTLAPGGRYLPLLPESARAAYLHAQQIDLLALLCLLALVARLQQCPEGPWARWLLAAGPRPSAVPAAILAIFLAALASFLRFYDLDYNGPFVDEALNVAWGQRILGGHPEALLSTLMPNLRGGMTSVPLTTTPIYPVLSALLTGIAGTAGMRAVSGLAGLLSVFFVFRIASDICKEWGAPDGRRRWLALLAAALYAFSAPALLASRFAKYPALAGLGFIAGVWLVNRGLRMGRSPREVALGAGAFGIGAAFWSADFYLGLATAGAIVVIRLLSLSLARRPWPGRRQLDTLALSLALVFGALWVYMAGTGYGAPDFFNSGPWAPFTLLSRLNEAAMMASIVIAALLVPSSYVFLGRLPGPARVCAKAALPALLVGGTLLASASVMPYFGGPTCFLTWAWARPWPDMRPVNAGLSKVVAPGDVVVLYSANMDMNNVWSVAQTCPDADVRVSSPWETIGTQKRFLAASRPRVLVFQQSGLYGNEVLGIADALGYKKVATIHDPRFHEMMTHIYTAPDAPRRPGPGSR